MEIFGRNRNSDQRFLICVILLFLITSLYHIYAGMDFFRSTGISLNRWLTTMICMSGYSAPQKMY